MGLMAGYYGYVDKPSDSIKRQLLINWVWTF